MNICLTAAVNNISVMLESTTFNDKEIEVAWIHLKMAAIAVRSQLPRIEPDSSCLAAPFHTLGESVSKNFRYFVILFEGIKILLSQNMFYLVYPQSSISLRNLTLKYCWLQLSNTKLYLKYAYSGI